MRLLVGPNANSLSVRAFAGTYVVLIAFNCDLAYCTGLLGFAIRRQDVATGEVHWLPALKRFDLPPGTGPAQLTTLEAPIQKFHWGDYTTQAGKTYAYEVHAMRGAKGALLSADMVSLTVTCENPDNVGNVGNPDNVGNVGNVGNVADQEPRHEVHYNRSAASSQAFAREFPNLPAGEITDPKARAWLSRGLAEALIAFIDDTKAGEGLHLFLYEFDKEEFAEALHEALLRGVRLEILHDGIIKGGKGPSLKADPLLVGHALDSEAKHRVGEGLQISHNKFMVRTDTAGTPIAVWTGSTNFTDAAIYGQSNVGHAIFGPEPATTYFTWHQDIWNSPDKSVANSRTDAMRLTQVPTGVTGTTLVLSPRTSVEALTRCAQLITGATDMVCFTAPFALYKDVEAALITTPAQVYGLLNLANVVTQALYAAPNTRLAAAGALDNASVLEAWQADLVEKESMHHKGVHIHTKVILIDPLSDKPGVIIGSANFSNNSSCNNDENQLFIFDQPAVADVYIGEFMRMFDHYYFRDHVKNTDTPFLDETDAWTAPFFDGGEKEKARTAYF